MPGLFILVLPNMIKCFVVQFQMYLYCTSKLYKSIKLDFIIFCIERFNLLGIFESMSDSIQNTDSPGQKVIELIEKNHSWDFEHGPILLQETRYYVLGLESLGYSSDQILAELLENGNIPHI